MNKICKILTLSLLLICLLGASPAKKPAEFSAKMTTTGDAIITLKVNDAGIRSSGKGSIERAVGSGKFESIAVFSKPKKKLSFTDKALPAGPVKYRTKIKYTSGGKKKSFSAVVTIGDSDDDSGTPSPQPTVRPTSTPSLFQPTPVPTQTTTGYFDSSGNVTSAGKTAFGIPSSFSANKNTGSSIWTSSCRPCHGSSEKTNRSYGALKASLPASPMFLTVPDQDVADLAAYLNRFRSS